MTGKSYKQQVHDCLTELKHQGWEVTSVNGFDAGTSAADADLEQCNRALMLTFCRGEETATVMLCHTSTDGVFYTSAALNKSADATADMILWSVIGLLATGTVVALIALWYHLLSR